MEYDMNLGYPGGHDNGRTTYTSLNSTSFWKGFTLCVDAVPAIPGD